MIVGFLLCFLFFRKSNTIESIVTEIDTLYIQSPPVIKWKTAYLHKVVLDTVFIVDLDTLILEKDTVQLAYDTVNFKEGHLATWYYFPPLNRFKYTWQPNPEKVLTITNTITLKPAWYKRPELWGGIGLLSGYFLHR